MAEALFWAVLDHFETLRPGFGGVKFRRLPRRFKRAVYALDSTTIKLFANCMDWAKHRRRKAAAKLHLRLNLESFLPAFAIVDSAKGHDSTKAHELCAGLKAGEIAVFDMAYIDYAHLFDLSERGVCWVSRVKESMKLRCVKRLLKKPSGRILRDDIVVVKNPGKRRDYPEAAAPDRRPRRDRRRRPRDELLHQQPPVGGFEHLRSLQGALEHRDVLQADQADAASGRLPRPQPQGDRVAGLDRAIDVRAAALPARLQ